MQKKYISFPKNLNKNIIIFLKMRIYFGGPDENGSELKNYVYFRKYGGK